jgi:hypothetical protein
MLVMFLMKRVKKRQILSSRVTLTSMQPNACLNLDQVVTEWLPTTVVDDFARTVSCLAQNPLNYS